MKTSAPFNFFAQALVANGNTAIPDLDALVSTIRAPVVVDEFWFGHRLYNDNDTYDLSAQIAVDLTLSAWKITDRPTVLSLLGPSSNIQPVTLYDAATAPGVLSRFYRWRLPRPMYMTPDDRLSVVFSRDVDAVVTDPVPVKINVVGRYVERLEDEKERAVPYVSSWLPALSTGAWAQSQAPDDLHNRLSKLLATERLIWCGRTPRAPSGATGTLQIKRLMRGANRDVLRVLSQAQYVAAGYRDIPSRAMLEPGEGYQATWTRTAGAGTPGLSLIGWREEPLS